MAGDLRSWARKRIKGAVAAAIAFIWLILGPQAYLLSCRSVILAGPWPSVWTGGAGVAGGAGG